jgi:hypothetical protein
MKERKCTYYNRIYNSTNWPAGYRAFTPRRDDKFQIAPNIYLGLSLLLACAIRYRRRDAAHLEMLAIWQVYSGKFSWTRGETRIAFAVNSRNDGFVLLDSSSCSRRSLEMVALLLDATAQISCSVL